MSTLELKKAVYLFCKEYIRLRLERINIEIKRIKESLEEETKSSAGDKHETGRAMVQLEREKLGQQLLEAEKMKKVLDRITMSSKKHKIGLGSLVQTDRTNYFVSISAGKFKSDEAEVFCISISSPIGKILMGKSVGQSFQFNETIQNIETIC